MELNGLTTQFLGRNVIFFNSIDSTQIKIKSLKEPKNGTVVIADNQIAAVGTHDRKWYTGSGKNIAMSFVLIPNCNIKKIENITLVIAECMVQALKSLYNLNLDIKKPNDIFCNGKKLGGILTQALCKGEVVKKLYVGIGLNVNQEQFPGKLSEIATSLKNEFGDEFEREKIIVAFFNRFETVYLDMINRG